MKLKACPFCGKNNLNNEGHYIECDDCGGSGPTLYPVPDHIESIRKWNTRPAPNVEGWEKALDEKFGQMLLDGLVMREWRFYKDLILFIRQLLSEEERKK